MTNAPRGYNDFLSNLFSESWSPFSQSGLDPEEFLLGVIIPVFYHFE